METETSETRNENDSVSRELRVTEDIVDFILIKKFSQMPYDDKIFITKTTKTPQPAMQNLIVNSRHNPIYLSIIVPSASNGTLNASG